MIRFFVLIGLVGGLIVAYMTTYGVGHIAQLPPEESLLTRFREEGFVPASLNLEEDEAAHDAEVFEVPPKDEEMLEAAIEAQGDMDMGGMDMSGSDSSMDMSGSDSGTMNMESTEGGMNMASGESGTMDMTATDGTMNMESTEGGMNMASGESGTMDMTATDGTMNMESTEGGMDMASGESGAMDMTATDGAMNMESTEGGMDMASGENGTMGMTATDGTMNMESTEGGMNMASGENGTMDMTATDGTMNMESTEGGMNMASGENGTMDMTAADGTMNMDSTEGGMDMGTTEGNMEMADSDADHGEQADTAEEGHGEMAQEGGGLSFTDDGKFDREITLAMAEWKFSEMSIDVKMGERIKFTVKNDGQIPHEFMFMTPPLMAAVAYRGTRADWSLFEHEALFEQALVLPGGEFTFVMQVQQAGSWMFMCMLPYHMQMGMMGQMATEGMAMDMNMDM